MYSVEVDGVRFVIRDAHLPPQETTGGKGTAAPVSRQHVESTSESTTAARVVPNSAQRRSAKRMAKHILEKSKKGSGPAKGPGSSATAEPTSTQPARVEPDVRADDATMETAEVGRGAKRAASESPSKAPAACELKCSQAGAAPHSRVESTRRPTLEAPTPRAVRPRALSPPKAPYTRPTCRTCGGNRPGPGMPGQWCRCKEPNFYDRLVYPPGGRIKWEATMAGRPTCPKRS